MTFQSIFIAMIVCTVPLAATAQIPPETQQIPPPVSDVTRLCVNEGCNLICNNSQNVTTVKDRAIKSIRTITLSNGNTEYRMDDGAGGANGKRTIFVSRENLNCAITGER